MGYEKLMVTFPVSDYHMTLEKQDVCYNQILCITKSWKCFVNTFFLYMLQCTLSDHISNLILRQN